MSVTVIVQVENEDDVDTVIALVADALGDADIEAEIREQ
jgi:hypothetical protein